MSRSVGIGFHGGPHARPHLLRPLSAHLDPARPCHRRCGRRGGNDVRGRAHASQLLAHGVGLVTLRETLGHSSMQVTIRYAHLGETALRSASEVIAVVAELPVIIIIEQILIIARFDVMRFAYQAFASFIRSTL